METKTSQIFIHLNKTKNEEEVRGYFCSKDTRDAS